MRAIQGLSIGRLADAADVNVETIRFYQRKGLLDVPDKPPGGIRRYTDTDLVRLRFIESAQKLGFRLGEVGELLALDDGRHCRGTALSAVACLAEVREKIRSLKKLERRWRIGGFGAAAMQGRSAAR